MESVQCAPLSRGLPKRPFSLSRPTRVGIQGEEIKARRCDGQRNGARLHHAADDASFPRDRVAQMHHLFYAFPTGADVQSIFSELFPGDSLPPDARLDFTPEVTDAADNALNPKGIDNARRIAATWSNGAVKARLRVVYTEYFRRNYHQIVKLGAGG